MNGQPPPYYGAPPPFPPGIPPMRPPMMMGMPPGVMPPGAGYPPPPFYGMPPGPPPPRPGFPGGLLPPPGMQPSPLAPLPLPPTEDPANWTEHAGQDGKMYYHNRVTKVSTYDKPACLNAPPPTAGAKAPPGPPPSLPPCKWKEYTAVDGKKYYSDGTSSLWEEPEELKTYKAKLKALEEEADDKIEVVGVTQSAPGATAPTGAVAGAKKRSATPEMIEVPDDDSEDGDSAAGSGGGGGEGNGSVDGNGSVAAMSKASAASSSLRAAVKEEPPDDDEGPLNFKTTEDAVAAFKQMLYNKGVSSTVKWGDVQKLLSKERCWGALKTGEKKQAFAEYQTKRMKEEKEEKRARARKERDSFLKMLAECVEIDSKSRWRTAEDLLKDDARFKTSELSEIDKEDIFNDFITELDKKEKEERRLNREAFAEMLKGFTLLPGKEKEKDKEGGKYITRDTTWAEAQELLDELATGDEESRLRDLVEEMDQRHAFEDVVEELKKAWREQKRLEREERRRVEEERRKTYRSVLQRLAEEGKINMESKWKHLKATIEQEDAYKAMVGQAGLTAAELFDKFVDDLRGRYLEDKRKLREFLPWSVSVSPDWTLEVYVATIKKALEEEAGVKEGKKGDVDQDDEQGDEAGGEEGDSSKSKRRKKESHAQRRLREFKELLGERPFHVKTAFEELHKRAVEAHEEEIRRQEKRRGRYRDLLLEYYWRSDHVDVSWKEAQRDLSRHSAYNDLDSSERKKLFEEHMAMLRSKMEKKKKSQKELLQAGKGKEKEKEKEKEKSKKACKRDDSDSGSASESDSSSSGSHSSSSRSSSGSSSESSDSEGEGGGGGGGGGRSRSMSKDKSKDKDKEKKRGRSSSPDKSKRDKVKDVKKKKKEEKEKSKRKRKDSAEGDAKEKKSRGRSRSRSRSASPSSPSRSRSRSRSMSHSSRSASREAKKSKKVISTTRDHSRSRSVSR